MFDNIDNISTTMKTQPYMFWIDNDREKQIQPKTSEENEDEVRDSPWNERVWYV